MSWSVVLRERWKILSKISATLTAVRSMGGGPRTFPGGLNKWQFKRMHEKMAREKERRLLEQEKEVYQARLRSQIRVKVAGRSPAQGDEESSSAAAYGPMTASDHVKALADRFTKEGAEDLWNEDDGPLRDDPVPRNPAPSRTVPPLDLRKMMSDRCKVADGTAWRSRRPVETPGRRRQYSSDAGRKCRPKLGVKSKWYPDSDSDSDLDSDFGLEGDPVKPFQTGGTRNPKFPRVSSVNADLKEEEVAIRAEKKKKIMLSGAALMNHDRKKERRAPKPKAVEKEDSLDEEVECIRDELEKRKRDLAATVGQEVEEEALLTPRRFEEYSISPLTVKALTCAGYVQLTVVQDAALQTCLDGNDVLVKARTGTGKSIAFLLPAIEAVLKDATVGVNNRISPILALILCPTRELASQVAAEANVLLKYHNGIGVLSLIGGTRFKVDQQRLESDPCQIIVATPGRLLDHIENKSGFSLRLLGLKILVLDEADHLLDLGFRKDIEKIVDCLPRKRQSLLFSATIPKEVRRISQVVLKREHTFIDTVGLSSQETPPKVSQSYIIAPHTLHFEVVHHLLKEHIMQEANYKVIVFCTTAMVTQLTFALLHNLKMNAREMHSRKPQLYRTRISDEFRESKRLILVTSDVSSRGMNYPDVTLVLQMGVPCDREQYIHRLGRTGREGKNGRGIMLLAPWEEYFLDEIRELPIGKLPMPVLNPDAGEKVAESMGKVDMSIKEAAYHAWLGYYNSISQTGRDKTTLVELANRFSSSMGLQCPPALFRRTALKMGLKDIPGIRVRNS
ncbi:unnamed protein product [Spirodela intermedia]|uniref:ATP-dependent RNA helicase n=1 Tax=Spirodela intermedia TaxID=51605 RepID=A0A7I8KMP7_SPIIN|nr:unnamed protein product [Spirodela intermedia]